VIRRITNERTESGAWGKLMGSGGCEVRIAGASESSEVMIGRMSAMKGEERGVHV